MMYGSHMFWGGAGWGVWGIVMGVGILAWTIVGVLLAVWLWKQINKK